MKLRSAKRYKVFLRYLLSYVLVLLIPFSLGIGAFYRMSVDLESNLMNDTLGMLDNRVMLLDQRFRELSDFVSQLSLDNRIQEFLSKPSPMTEGSSVWSVVELQQILAPYRLGNTFIYTFHLYFATSRTVLTPFYSFIEIPFFYGPYFRYGTMDAAEWFSTLLDTFHQRTMLPSTELSFYDKSMRALTYIQSIPLSRTALNRGAIVLFIPEDEILLHLADFSDVPGHVVSVSRADQALTASIEDSGGHGRHRAYEERITPCGTLRFDSPDTYSLSIEPEKLVSDNGKGLLLRAVV